MKTALILFTLAIAVTVQGAKVLVYGLSMTNTVVRSDTGEVVETEILTGRLVLLPRTSPLGLPADAHTIFWGDFGGTNVFVIDCPDVTDGYPFTNYWQTKWTLTYDSETSWTAQLRLRGANTWVWWTPTARIWRPQVLRGSYSESYERDGVLYTGSATVTARFLINPTRQANQYFLTPTATIAGMANTRRTLGYVQVRDGCF